MLKKIALTTLCLAAVACGKSRSSERLTSTSLSETLKFPAGFLWGTATAAEQMEATTTSDWAQFIAKNYTREGQPVANAGIKDLHTWPANVIKNKTAHNLRMAEDVKLMKEMGANAYRFSIAWDKLFPTATQAAPETSAVAFYDSLFSELKKNGIEPSVTLFHFSSPAWFFAEKNGKRGWERDDAISHFTRFVTFVVNRWGKSVKVWCTLNEPMVYVYSGYMQGIFPPLEKRPNEAAVAPVVEGLLRAHAAAYKIIKAANGSALVGVTQHTREFSPYRNYAILDRIVAGVVEQAFIWDFTDAIQTGRLKITNTDVDKTIDGLKGTQDYLGINYYGRFYLKTNIFSPTKFEILNNDANDAKEIKNELGWADYPRGMRTVLLKGKEKYNLPLYVMESGTAQDAADDKLRQQLIVTTLAETAQAIKAGADVRGYFHWSLIDNFEWAEGYNARFGLVEIDYKNNFARKKRNSFSVYKDIISNGVSPAVFNAAAKAY